MDMHTATKASDPAHGDSPFVPTGRSVAEAAPGGRSSSSQPSTGWCAAALVDPVRVAGVEGLLYAASSERRADEIGRALRQLAPDVEVLVLPPWDCLPYDRASPSRECMGRRMAVLARLHEAPDGPRVLVASVESLMQRLPPPRVLKAAFLTLRVGDVVERNALQAFAAATGYVADDRIDEPGEIAILGAVIDIYPAGAAAPVRLALDARDCIEEIRRYDPVSQRTEELLQEVLLGPASELILSSAQDVVREPGAEHRAAETYGKMPSLFQQFTSARMAADPLIMQRAETFADQIAEAYETRRSLGEAKAVASPGDLYLGLTAFRGACSRRTRVDLEASGVSPMQKFASERNPGRAFADFVRERLDAGRRVVLAGLAHELRPLSRAVQRGLDQAPAAVATWDEVSKAAAGRLLALTVDLEAGFDDEAAELTVIAASDVLGGRIAARGGGDGGAALAADPDLRLGDVVIHEDYGLGVLRELERVEVDGRSREALRLEYHGGSGLLVPVEDFGKLWRYGAEPGAVSLDRLHTDAWSRRRIELSAHIDETAVRLVELARARAESSGEAVQPPKAAYARFSARFAYPETPDQAAAIQAVLNDMASGRVMSRLVCGDVGFGKTEVALRAVAAAALCGKQVAVVAPTTVLARQHFETFRRRFAGTGVEVARLSRLASASEARSVKQGLADGSIGVVVGTHAIAAEDVAFANLALLVIDEEQRFGAGLKARLRALAPRAHLLTMTATPIPRTLQLALVGVEDVSVIATPPARRRPIRTFLAPWDAASVRTALMRERRRGGQSFVVVPRIEDIEPLARELAGLVPELSVRIVHGGLSPEEADEVMVGFAGGQGDVLLATNIIESGLDVPRANTMLVRRADMFGLAQLHQLRGRVGRGRAQGIAYLLHDPDQELPDATRARLSTLEALDRLGAGMAISARDLELRGAGDLIGEEQAGHLKLIGTALYQRLLTRAVRVAKGEITQPEWTPELNIGLSGAIPESYVPDPCIRINLYARLARMSELGELEAFTEELEDRFSAPPEEVTGLLDLTRIRLLACAAGVARIDAGPKAVAFTMIGPTPVPPEGMTLKDGRLILPKPAADPAPRTAEICALLQALAA